MMRAGSLVIMVYLFAGSSLFGQSSSLLLAPPPPATPGAAHNGPGFVSGAVGTYGTPVNGGNPRDALFLATEPRDEVLPMTRTIENASLYAIPAQIPRKFKVEDLITIIVRQHKKYEADAELEAKKNWNTSGKLSEWFRFYEEHRLGQSQLRHGEPGFKFDFNNKYKTEGENDREDSFTTRVTARIIDVKPNGNLVLEATLEQQHDEEVSQLTITGICRSTDVTPDNTVLSTQVAELRIVEKNRGAVRDATTRGWVPRILHFGGGPF